MSMKKVWIVAVFALAAVSCVRMEDISCDGVESVEVRSLGASRSLVEVSVRASNASGAAVSIVRADLTLDRGETTLLRASVDEKVRLPRRSEEATVRIPVEIRFAGGLLGALGAMGTLSSGARGTTVSGEVVLKAGMMRKKYKVERMDTDAFLRQFGIDLSEMMEEFGLLNGNFGSPCFRSAAVSAWKPGRRA